MREDKKYYIFLDGKKVYVTEEVYKSYWQITNKERYLYKLDRKNRLSYFSEFDSENDVSIDEKLADANVDVEKLLETKEKIENLYKALDSLTTKEKEIIQALYFDDVSMRELAEKMATNHRYIGRTTEKILKKLKITLED